MKYLSLLAFLLLLGACASNNTVEEGSAEEVVAETQQEPTVASGLEELATEETSDPIVYQTAAPAGWTSLTVNVLRYGFKDGKLVSTGTRAEVAVKGAVLKFLDEEYILKSKNTELVVVMEDLNSVYPSQIMNGVVEWLEVKQD